MAAGKYWSWSSDPFDGPAENSDENGMKQILFHDAAIKANMELYPLDLDFPIWYNRFHPLRIAAEAEYTIVYSIEGTGKSQTEIITRRLKGLKGKNGKGRDWYNRVSAINLITNPARITAIFPNGLKTINRGKKDVVIAFLLTMSKQMEGDTNPLMMAIKAEIDAEYAIIKPNRSTQQTTLKKKGITRTDLGTAIDLALKMQWGDLGLEINKFMNDPDSDVRIKAMHNLEEIQSSTQKVFNSTLTALETKDLVKRTLVFNSKLRCAVTSGDVWVYLSSTAGGTDSLPVKILNGVPKEFTASAFGITDYGLHCHITVVNRAGVKVSFLLQLY